MFTTGLMRLHRAGKVTNRKGFCDGVSICTFAAGSQELYDWLDGNPDVRFLPVDRVNDPSLIARNRRMISLNGALAVDLLGQVAADTIGAGDGGLDRIWHLTLPAVALALTGVALIVRVTRAAMIAALEQDYMVFARARGLPWRHVLMRYGLRNALVPIITAGGLILAAMMGGVVLVEVTFSIPGLGQLLVESVNFQDVPMVQGTVLIAAASVIAINLVADVLYSVVDPRIRLGQ